MPEEHRSILAIVFVSISTRVKLNLPEMSPGGDNVGLDAIADGKLLALIVVDSELEDRRAQNVGPRLWF
jgi:hypothetical protein